MNGVSLLAGTRRTSRSERRFLLFRQTSFRVTLVAYTSGANSYIFFSINLLFYYYYYYYYKLYVAIKFNELRFENGFVICYMKCKIFMFVRKLPQQNLFSYCYVHIFYVSYIVYKNSVNITIFFLFYVVLFRIDLLCYVMKRLTEFYLNSSS